MQINFFEKLDVKVKLTRLCRRQTLGGNIKYGSKDSLDYSCKNMYITLLINIVEELKYRFLSKNNAIIMLMGLISSSIIKIHDEETHNIF